ncbi:MAG: T9SS type A sorting domain-containing protein [Bacteroidia bacterium]
MIKKNLKYIWLPALVLFASCSNWSNIIPKSSFDAPFPKKNKDLTQVLGNKLYIKRGKDTTRLSIAVNGIRNIITDKNGDTIFYGSVSKFRGLYYFSQQLNDTSYLIYAVKLKGNYLYGLNAPWYEGKLIDRSIARGEYKGLIKSISADSSIIRLHPDKKEMRKLYAMIMDSLPPDTLLAVPANMNVPAKIDTNEITQQVDPEDYEMFSKVYPNPATNEVNIELQQRTDVKYMLSDITGKTLTNGELHDSVNKVDISALQNGIYVLTLAKADGKGEESVKIIKH